MKDIQIRLPEQVEFIMNVLQKEGYEAYAVGGCVRDAILNRVPEDWDITTSAMPEEIKKLFCRTFDTGIEHGTITVVIGTEHFELTTYRIDGKYEDNRHPKEVLFTGCLQEDLRRRDFTINAMAYNQKEGLVDVFGGQIDLEQGVIRCVGNAHERFSEDALRILRGLRFSAQLGFDIEEKTKEGMQKLAPTLKKISAERIQIELIKMLVSPRPQILREAYRLNITKEFLEEFDLLMETEQETPHHQYSVGEHTLCALGNVRADKILRLVVLFHDMGKPAMKTKDEEGVAHFKKHAAQSEKITKQVLRRLKFDNDTLHKVSKLVLYHDYRTPAVPQNVRRAINKIGVELFPYYLEVRKADVLAQSMYERDEKLKNIEDTKNIYEEIMRAGQCVSLKGLAINGSDLLESGMQPGKELGEALNRLLELVLEYPEMNNKEELLKWIHENRDRDIKKRDTKI